MIEIPELKGGSMNIFHTWTTKENGKETPVLGQDLNRHRAIVSS